MKPDDHWIDLSVGDELAGCRFALGCLLIKLLTGEIPFQRRRG